MILTETQFELLATIQTKLRRNDISTIATKTGLSREYVSRVLSPNHAAFNEDIVENAVKIISTREQNTKYQFRKLIA